MIQAPAVASVSNCDDVSCGVEFTMWLCQGKVFSAGLPQYGQLGHNTDNEYNAKDCKPFSLNNALLQSGPKISAFHIKNKQQNRHRLHMCYALRG